MEKSLQALVAGTASVTGEEFFPVLVRHLAEALGVRYIILSEKIGENPGIAKVIAFWAGDQLGENFEYDLGNTPCEIVFQTGMSCYSHNVRQLFPLDQDLVTLQAESYLGTLLLDMSNNPIGHIAVLDTQPILQEERAKAILSIFAARTTAELRRLHTEKALRQKAQELEDALRELSSTQAQLIQTEKMSSLGHLVAGVAHEINNPVNFIHGNITPTTEYTQDLLNLIKLYQKYYPQPVPEIQAEIKAIDLDFLSQDLSKILNSMKMGSDRIRKIVLSLRNFSRLDEAEMKSVDIHEGIDSTLLLLRERLKGKEERPEILIVKEYSQLPPVECYAGQLNQVFMNLLANAIDALEESELLHISGENHSRDRLEHRYSQEELSKTNKLVLVKERANKSLPTIRIRTEVKSDQVLIKIADNGSGMTEETCKHIFDPFFSTKPVGKGTGMGLPISYQIIVQKHHGQLQYISEPGQGSEFIIAIPLRQECRHF